MTQEEVVLAGAMHAVKELDDLKKLEEFVNGEKEGND